MEIMLVKLILLPPFPSELAFVPPELFVAFSPVLHALQSFHLISYVSVQYNHHLL